MSNLPTIKQIISNGIERLTKANIDSPQLNANYIAASVFNTKRGRLPLLWNEIPNENHMVSFRTLVERRCQREPLQYILGEWGFMDISVSVGPNALIPRPETEEMIDELLLILRKKFGNNSFKFADIGSGTGAIGIVIALAFKNSIGFSSDISFDALEIAKININSNLKIDNRLALLNQNLMGSFKALSLDCIVSNPPYISEADMLTLQPEIRYHEPSIALIGGIVGTEIIFDIIKQANNVIKKDGILAIEHGHGQREQIVSFASNYNFKPLFLGTDLGNKERFIIWTKI